MCILFNMENDNRKVVLRCVIKKYSAEVRSENRKILLCYQFYVESKTGKLLQIESRIRIARG